MSVVPVPAAVVPAAASSPATPPHAVTVVTTAAQQQQALLLTAVNGAAGGGGNGENSSATIPPFPILSPPSHTTTTDTSSDGSGSSGGGNVTNGNPTTENTTPPSLPSSPNASMIHPNKIMKHHHHLVERESKGVNVTYRRAILKAMESLHDYQSRSNIDMVRRHTQDLLFEQGILASSHHNMSHEWNDALFLQTLKSIVRKGEVDLFCKSTAELTPTYKKQRADSLVHRLEEKIVAAARAAAQCPIAIPSHPQYIQHQPHHSHLHHHGHLPPQLYPLHHQQMQSQMQSQSSMDKCPESPKPTPRRRSEHEKWKIIPKKIFDHSTIVNPMDTH